MNSTFGIEPTTSVNAVTTAPPIAAQAYFIEPNPSKIFRYVLYALLFLFAVVGNIAVCVVPIRQKRMRTFTYFLITNLAVSDIGTMLCLPPLLMFDYTSTWSIGETMCKLVNPSLTMFSLITTNTLVAIAIDRFMSLVFPFVRRPQKKETILVVTLTWLVAFACVLPSFGARKLTPIMEGGHVFVYCDEEFPGDTVEDKIYHKKIYDIALYLINNTIPIIIISLVYVIIIFKLKGISLSKVFKRKSSKSSFEGYSQPALNSDEVYLKQKNERERKFMQMLLSVVVVFVLFYVPVQTLFLLNTLLPSTSGWYYLYITYYYLYLMMWVPNALNPILYGAMNEQYARAFKKILCCRWKSRKDGFGSTLGSYSRAPTTTKNTRNDVAGSNTRETEMTLM
ncbi:orexin receptor type 2-like [Actinia tenebrosa]|uniref:Orexin receptor type 2-like n=1 Tax=Actinia tenebrosa TaxID=6105 RepID=A0A6P8IBE0_ACTTE|nr:orexin receptor type 2-like [Actinia tenebrosa]XP_031564602.1 orexin receptor type 2-like [Actinia tenebrosa]XP_031564603.1 orexin receptor type 2-like [Actinia tenebrosa]XP_031564604.1 orexin receptor type 2-like [Actinia tenebrosa]XP_031564605.1 orexin receptor type 2-like [Actinia tenebrosa]XP_031564607.1 orexin receptor type 2-like [Actinia tenebrosa]XP_031564608.1 orexin receptor type 2-like [Actinia tenebrosa]XP_031564609.1 orexin receptor type 2-like [Actinia tenebrosa]XP_03156461